MEMKEQQSVPEAPHMEHTTAPIPEEDMGAQTNGVEEEPSATLADLSPEALQEQLMQQCRKTEEYLDHLQRLQADFNNYRRRANQEKQLATSRGKEDVLRALLPVLANFRLALQHAQEDANAVRQGVQMIWQQFEGFLRDQGVERIETVGQPFDPAQHEALSMAPATAETPANTIVAEINAGYQLDGRLLRPAQVVVAHSEETSATPENTPPRTSLDIEA
jgi:molecular chaperone GrpE